MKRFNILYDPGAEGSGGGGTSGSPAGGSGTPAGLGGGAAATDWRTSLPDELKNDASLHSIKDVASLAKGYVHAQKLVGADKIAKPSDKWDEKQWGEFYDAAGRPKEAKDYSFPKDVKMPTGLELDPKSLDDAKAVFHKAGLSGKQAEAVLGYYAQLVGQGHVAKETDSLKAKETLMADLQKEWGTTTDHRLSMANQVAVQFGGTDLLDALTESGLHMNPHVIKAFAKIAENLSEDSMGGRSGGLQIPVGQAAQQEINQLLQDPVFTKAWLSGDKLAIDRMSRLQQAAVR